MRKITGIGMVILAILFASNCLNNPVTMLLSSKGGALVKMVPPPGRRDTPHGERCTGYPFHALLQNTDQWEHVRSTVDYFVYQDWILNQQQFFTDDDLSLYFSIINTWPSKFTIDSSCLKGDDDCHRDSADESWNIVYPMWNRFEGLGAQIDALSIDESFCAVRKPWWTGPSGDEYAVQETAEWIYRVRTQFDPDIEICSIEPYPSFSVTELIWWIDELNAECQRLGVDGIQAFSLDVNWGGNGVNWNDVAALEDSCQARHIRFEMIYWASPHYRETDEDVDFYNDIHKQGRMYQAAGGTPDVYTIQDWNYIPRQMVPEDEPWSFTYSMQSFINTFVPK